MKYVKMKRFPENDLSGMSLCVTAMLFLGHTKFALYLFKAIIQLVAHNIINIIISQGTQLYIDTKTTQSSPILSLSHFPLLCLQNIAPCLL